jgi:hypothetical protein
MLALDFIYEPYFLPKLGLKNLHKKPKPLCEAIAEPSPQKKADQQNL